MYIKEEKVRTVHYRKSKLGLDHQYTRILTVLTLRCDNCLTEFTRYKSNLCAKRRSNKYYHCCDACDSKRFAQSKGVEKRTIWNIPVSSTITIDKL